VVYVGSPTDPLAAGSTTKKYLQVIKNANGKVVPAETTTIPGSLLLIAEPAYMEFTTSQELYPIVYESVEGDWEVTVHADPPEGFISSPGALSATIVVHDLETLQFTIQDVGSSWTATQVTHQIHHNGRDSTVVLRTPMINKRGGTNDRGRRPHDGTATAS